MNPPYFLRSVKASSSVELSPLQFDPINDKYLESQLIELCSKQSMSVCSFVGIPRDDERATLGWPGH